MTRTVEIIHEDDGSFTVKPQGHSHTYTVNGFTLDLDGEVVHEDGMTRADIHNSKYFDIEVRQDGDFVVIQESGFD